MSGAARCGPSPCSASRRFSRAAAVDATIHEFPEGTPTAEEAARAAGCSLEQIVKSLVFVCDGEYALALVPGDRRADEAKVAEAVGASAARVARAAEVLDGDRVRARRRGAVPARMSRRS